MKITKSKLKQIIKEELQKIREVEQFITQTSTEEALATLNTFNDNIETCSEVLDNCAEEPKPAEALAKLQSAPFVRIKNKWPEKYDDLKDIAIQILKKLDMTAADSIPPIPFGGWKGSDKPSKREQEYQRLGRYLHRVVNDKLIEPLDKKDTYRSGLVREE
ncbi:MAG TPA: hypothetical protein EYG21_07945 [Nitrospinaceae bacterium]|nr:hypothetical protein [Nitrospinaceae bacterium]